MYVRERQRLIMAALSEQGRVTVTALAEHLDVSAETIRRDLAALELEGELERTHGGAVPPTPGGRSEHALAERIDAHRPEKAVIASLALDLLPPPGGSILLDAGSTTAALAAALPVHHGLSIITGSAPIATELTAAGTSEVHVLGGRVRPLTGACVGPVALRALSRIRCDIAFIGTNGLNVERGLTTPDPDEAAIKRAMCRAARRVVVLADSSKLGPDHLVSFAGLEDIDVIVTTAPPAAAMAVALDSAGIEVLHP